MGNLWRQVKGLFFRIPRLIIYVPPWLRWQIFFRANPHFLVGAVALILNERGEVLLFNHTYRSDEYAWGLPGGWLKHNETPEEGLARELYEESRLVIKVDRNVSVKISKRYPRVDLIYRAEVLSGEFTPSYEVTEARYFPIDSLPLTMKEHIQAIQEEVGRVRAVSGD